MRSVKRSRAAKTAMRVGNWRAVVAASRAQRKSRYNSSRSSGSVALQRVNALSRMIETKESQRRVVGVNCQHNNCTILNINPFLISQGVSDPQNADSGNRVGDAISVKGMLIKAFFQNQDQRAKVYFRVMMIRCAKGDTPDRTNLFKQSADNKMLDQVNTERFSIVYQKIFNITASNNVASSVIPTTGVPAGATPAGIGTRTFSAWIPGRKFGRNGVVRYENQSTSQVKFYDYKIVVVCYDWYQTFQDTNNVGFVNELYTKIYFKDA